MLGARFDSPAVRLESGARTWALVSALAALVWFLSVLGLALFVAPFSDFSPLLVAVPALVYVVAALVRGRTGRARPAQVRIEQERVTIEREDEPSTVQLSTPREGWSTPLDGRAIVSLRTRDHQLLSVQLAKNSSAELLSAARATENDLPLAARLDQPPDWSARLRAARFALRHGWRLAFVSVVVLMFWSPRWAVVALFGEAAVLAALRAAVVFWPPEAVVAAEGIELGGLGSKTTTSYARIASVDATPRGVVVTLRDGSEIVVPLAAGVPIRRGRRGLWTSEARFRDSELARRDAVVEALRRAQDKSMVESPIRA